MKHNRGNVQLCPITLSCTDDRFGKTNQKMKINIVGYGTVGNAQAYLLRKLGHEVYIFDPYLFPDIKSPERNVDISFICTPDFAVENAIRNLIENKVDGLVVIKSTVPIGTTEELSKKFKIHICHNPEFLREAHAYEDVMNPDRIVIGQCCPEHGKLLISLYSPLKKPIYVTSSKTSETVKLLSNSYLAMLITFWNEANELCKQLGLDIREVANLVCADRRMSRYGTRKFGEAFGGKCLPKDLNHLREAFRKFGLNPLLFDAIQDYNNKLKGR